MSKRYTLQKRSPQSMFGSKFLPPYCPGNSKYDSDDEQVVKGKKTNPGGKNCIGTSGKFKINSMEIEMEKIKLI